MNGDCGNDVKAASLPLILGRGKPKPKKSKKPKTRHGFGPHGPAKIFGAK